MQKSNNTLQHDLHTIILALPSSEFCLARTCVYIYKHTCARARVQRERERGGRRALWKRLMLIEETYTSMSVRIVYNGLTCVN